MSVTTILKRLTVGIAGTALLASAASAADFSSRTIRISIGVPLDHPQAVGLQRFADRLAELSEGKMNAKVFPNAQLGNDSKSTESLRAGTLEMNSTSTSPLAQLVPELGVFDFPFLFDAEREADPVLDGPIGDELGRKLPEKNLILLCWMENGFRNLTNSVRPVRTAEDLKGIKLRVMQNSIFLDAFAALGANPVAMAFSEVYPALESRAIDAQENPNPTILATKLYEVQKYLATTRHVYTPFMQLVSKRFWDKLSDDEKGAMRTACHEARDFQRKLTREADVKALETLKGHGMEVTEIAPEERAKMREITQPVVDEHAKEIGEDFVERFYAEVEKVRGRS